MRVYVNNRDLLTWPRAMVEVLRAQGHDVTVIDNASTYRPLLDWYDSQPAGVSLIRLAENTGHLAPWYVIGRPREPYVVTDPDLDISAIPADWPEVLLAGLKHTWKCGFHLDETRVPASNPAWKLDDFARHPNNDHPARWAPSLRMRVGAHEFYRHPIDTTFAAYSPSARPNIGGIRSAPPYIARHLPWHIVLDPDTASDALQVPLDDELYYYYTHASSVSTTRGRMREMLAEYARRRQQ